MERIQIGLAGRKVGGMGNEARESSQDSYLDQEGASKSRSVVADGIFELF
jgi:hypothetical protein